VEYLADVVGEFVCSGGNRHRVGGRRSGSDGRTGARNTWGNDHHHEASTVHGADLACGLLADSTLLCTACEVCAPPIPP